MGAFLGAVVILRNQRGSRGVTGDVDILMTNACRISMGNVRWLHCDDKGDYDLGGWRQLITFYDYVQSAPQAFFFGNFVIKFLPGLWNVINLRLWFHFERSWKLRVNSDSSSNCASNWLKMRMIHTFDYVGFRCLDDHVITSLQHLVITIRLLI